MSTSEFDPFDPWHSWIDFVFYLSCDQCGTKIDLDWSKVDNADGESYLRQCVALAEKAKAAGWTHQGDDHFLCPVCSSPGATATP